ncbi:MAG: SGNH/GDSL hydrolase family protein [Acidobacteriota bacterium]
MRTSTAKNVALAVASTLLLAGLLEGVSRLAGPVGPAAAGGEIAGGHLRDVETDWFEPDADLLWRWRPGTTVRRRGSSPKRRHEWTCHINAQGRRGAPIPASPGRPIVLCAGDSVTAGFGVDDAETYPVRLEELLRESAATGGATVINAGVNGYSSEQGRLLLAREIPRWRPDVVIACYGINDDGPTVYADTDLLRANAVRSTQRVLAASRAYQRLRAAIVGLKLRRAVAARRVGPRVPLERYRQNLRAIAALARASGARLIFVAPTSSQEHSTGTEHQPLVAPLSVYRAAMASVALEERVPFVDDDLLSGRLPASRHAFNDFCHPDAAGLCLLARDLASAISR